MATTRKRKSPTTPTATLFKAGDVVRLSRTGTRAYVLADILEGKTLRLFFPDGAGKVELPAIAAEWLEPA